MRHGIWSALVVSATLLVCGCASQPSQVPASTLPWQDQHFDLASHAVTLDAGTLFQLDPQLLRQLQDGEVAKANAGRRNTHLLELVFGSDMQPFAYAGGHSTVAADTWSARRGDCLSLSIMTLALARALELKAHVQEVRVPPTFDRRGSMEFFNAHVNVLLSNDRPLRAMRGWLPAGDFVVDFEPQPGTRQRGTALDDSAVLARFLNNRAAEHMAAGRDGPAYAHFKAAIQADPGFAAAYNNLAQLYLRHGLARDAETLLHSALARDDESDLALAALHGLLVSQERLAEAQAYEQQLHARRERDPYYWLGLGIDHLQHGRDRQAVRALEQAQRLSNGFEEVHRHLAVAYWRTGQAHKARDQLAVLLALGQGESAIAQLHEKFKSKYHTPALQ
jgi:Flp pilus assembly protein TadD